MADTIVTSAMTSVAEAIPAVVETVPVAAEVTAVVAEETTIATALTATGLEAAEAALKLEKFGPVALDLFAKANVNASTPQEAFFPFIEMSEEEFAEKYPELASSTPSISREIGTESKIIPFNDKVAEELHVEPYGKTQKHFDAETNVVSGDLAEGEEVDLKKKSLEEKLKEMDLSDDMREKLPAVIEMLRDYPDLMEALGDVQKLDKDKKDALIAKINALIKDETDPDKQSLLMLLLTMLLGFVMTTNHEIDGELAA